MTFVHYTGVNEAPGWGSTSGDQFDRVLRSLYAYYNLPYEPGIIIINSDPVDSHYLRMTRDEYRASKAQVKMN